MCIRDRLVLEGMPREWLLDTEKLKNLAPGLESLKTYKVSNKEKEIINQQIQRISQMHNISLVELRTWILSLVAT